MAAPLHDLGKIAIPDSILIKPGKLTVEERRIIETHCTIGGRMLGDEFEELLDVRCLENKDKTAAREILCDPVLDTAREIALTYIMSGGTAKAIPQVWREKKYH